MIVSGFCKYKVYADIRGGSSGCVASNDSWVVNDSIFGDLGSYFFGNFRDKASNITGLWRYATPCRPVTDCQMPGTLTTLYCCKSSVFILDPEFIRRFMGYTLQSEMRQNIRD